MASYDYQTLTGVIVPDTSETKTEVQNEYKEIFGEDIDLSDETPEGVLINAETQSRNGIAINNSNLANQINPNKAGGVFLDAIWALTSALTGGRRSASNSTISNVSLTGQPGTVINQGSIALAGAGGDEFETVSQVTLDGSGNATVDFRSVLTGQIAAGIGELDTIGPGAPLGWETVSNTEAAVLGEEEESDAASRIRREDTLADQGISVSAAVSAAMASTDGVKSHSYRENFTDTDQTIDGIFLVKHSVFACVDGGTDTDVAQALLDNKTAGANWNGSTTENVTDETSGQSYPVKFERPDGIEIWVRVTIGATTSSNASDIVTEAVLAYADGEIDGERGFSVGNDISPYEIASAVNLADSSLFVKKVELSTDGITYVATEISIALDEVGRADASRIDTVIQA